MSAEAVCARAIEAEELFGNIPAGPIGPRSIPSSNEAQENITMKSVFKELGKNKRLEITKWWEHYSLNKYADVGRVPRGLRIMLAPSFDKPNPLMLKE